MAYSHRVQQLAHATIRIAIVLVDERRMTPDQAVSFAMRECMGIKRHLLGEDSYSKVRQLALKNVRFMHDNPVLAAMDRVSVPAMRKFMLGVVKYLFEQETPDAKRWIGLDQVRDFDDGDELIDAILGVLPEEVRAALAIVGAGQVVHPETLKPKKDDEP